MDMDEKDFEFVTFGLPKRSIFQQLSENDVTSINYSNTSIPPDAEFKTWVKTRNKSATNVKPISQFLVTHKLERSLSSLILILKYVPVFTPLSPYSSYQCSNYLLFIDKSVLHFLFHVSSQSNQLR
jgi:hypothetical protein